MEYAVSELETYIAGQVRHSTSGRGVVEESIVENPMDSGLQEYWKWLYIMRLESCLSLNWAMNSTDEV